MRKSLLTRRSVQSPLPKGVVAEGYLWLLTVGGLGSVDKPASTSWKRRYFVLHEHGLLSYFKSGRVGVGGRPKGGAWLNGDFFVGDSLLRKHGFQVSDFETTVYLAADLAKERLDWMFKLGLVLKRAEQPHPPAGWNPFKVATKGFAGRGNASGWAETARQEAEEMLGAAHEALESRLMAFLGTPPEERAHEKAGSKPSTPDLTTRGWYAGSKSPTTRRTAAGMKAEVVAEEGREAEDGAPKRVVVPSTASMVSRFNQQVAQVEEQNKSNPFSKSYAGSAAKTLKKGDAGYGTAVAGSKTEERARAAQEWVEKEILKLIDVIKQQGQTDEATGEVSITFGVLFAAYADISDTLVGILMRARKRKQLAFTADMLFQGVHDHVAIRLL